MRTRRLRYWLIFFLATFALHGVASAVGLCAQDLFGPRHDVAQVLAAAESACPDSDSSAPCPKHYAQSAKTSVEKVLGQLPVPAHAPPSWSVRIAALPPADAERAVVDARPVFGPPLTILFGRRRD